MNDYRLEFEKLIEYDAGESGITINTTLKISDNSVSFPAKIDTGSAFCIFERKHGEKLGFEIETGLFQKSARQPEFSPFTGLESFYKPEILNSIRSFISLKMKVSIEMF